jgi:cytochrome c553
MARMRAKSASGRAGITAACLVLALTATADEPAATPAPAAPAAAAPAAPATGDVRRGGHLAYTCYGCHGIPGYRNAYPGYHVPMLGGQHAGYLSAALGEYKSGARHHPTMSGQAGSFDQQALSDLAAFFATAHPVEAGTAVGTAPPAAAVCQACHGATGVGIMAEYPTLSGQYSDYLEQALKAYRSGARQNAIMQGFASTLKDSDIQALSSYFAQQQPALRTPEAPQHPGE